MKKEKITKVEGVKNLDEAVKLLPELSTSKFVGSVDIDVVLNLKQSQKKEIIRGSVSLPHSLGEEKKVIVFCEEKDLKKAIDAGASKAGLEDLMAEVEKGFSDFDVVIATPAVMPKIARLGKALGPKGLMPNPKNGTITTDLDKAISSFKAGRINYKSVPDQGVIRMKVAKVNMKPEEIKANTIALLKSIYNEAKRLNGSPLKKVTLSPTMGASIKLDISDIMAQV